MGKRYIGALKVIPSVEKRYRTTPDRTLCGSSLGGLFVLYASIKVPGFFKRAVSLSPYLEWAESRFLKLEEQMTKENRKKSFHTRLYIAAGDQEFWPQLESIARKFSKRLKARNYTGLRLTYQALEQERHATAKAEGYNNGLRFVFQPDSIQLDEQEQKEYVGRYQFSYFGSPVEFAVYRRSEKLYCKSRFFGEDNFLIEPLKKDLFISRSRPFELRLGRDKDGQLKNLTLRFATYMAFSGVKLDRVHLATKAE